VRPEALGVLLLHHHMLFLGKLRYPIAREWAIRAMRLN